MESATAALNLYLEGLAQSCLESLAEHPESRRQDAARRQLMGMENSPELQELARLDGKRQDMLLYAALLTGLRAGLELGKGLEPGPGFHELLSALSGGGE